MRGVLSFLQLLTLVRLVRLSWPVVLSRLGIMVMGLTDAIVVGQISATELSYHSLGWAPTSVLLTTAVGLLMGTQVVTAQHIGEGRADQVGGVLRRGLIYSLWIGGIGTIFLFLAVPPLLALSVVPELLPGSVAAMKVFALSIPFYMVSVACSLFMEGLGRPKPAMWIMWLANGVNLVLNLWFVPGGPDWIPDGAVGSGWATFGARLFLMGAMVAYILSLPEVKSWGLFSPPRDTPADAIRQRRIGYGSGSSYFVEISAFAAMTLLSGAMGTAAVASWTIVLNVSAIIFMVPLGLSAATSVLVGRAYGARSGPSVYRTGIIAFALALLIGAVVTLVIGFAHTPVVMAYTRDPAVVAMAGGALFLACLFFVTDGLQAVAAQALRARGDDLWPTLMHILSYAVVMIPLAWWLGLHLKFGVDGIVWATILASALSASLLVGRFLRLGRQMPVRTTPDASDTKKGG